MGGKAARREEESLASEHGLEDFASCPERVVSKVSPIGVGTIKGDENWWRHHGAGVWTAQPVATGQEVLIEHSDFPSKISVEVGNNAIATASSRNRPVKATGRNLYATAPEHAEATSS